MDLQQIDPGVLLNTLPIPYYNTSPGFLLTNPVVFSRLPLELFAQRKLRELKKFSKFDPVEFPLDPILAEGRLDVIKFLLSEGCRFTQTSFVVACKASFVLSPTAFDAYLRGLLALGCPLEREDIVAGCAEPNAVPVLLNLLAPGEAAQFSTWDRTLSILIEPPGTAKGFAAAETLLKYLKPSILAATVSWSP